ncbi:MAG: hypothetical protein IJP29_07340 [Lachnospiraceae bacterium]|nr:hypothetical protein [Lachnospiraceae bacterium]
MIVSILYVLMALSQILFWVCGDLLIAKTKLKYAKRFVAEIAYFAEIEVSRSSPAVLTVVKYLDNGKEKKAVFYKDKRDKVGKKIEIVASDKLAVRNGIFYPVELKIIRVILVSVIMIWLGPYLYEYFDIVIVVIMGLTMLLLTVMSVCDICFREMFDDELKSALHWE